MYGLLGRLVPCRALPPGVTHLHIHTTPLQYTPTKHTTPSPPKTGKPSLALSYWDRIRRDAVVRPSPACYAQALRACTYSGDLPMALSLLQVRRGVDGWCIYLLVDGWVDDLECVCVLGLLWGIIHPPPLPHTHIHQHQPKKLQTQEMREVDGIQDPYPAGLDWAVRLLSHSRRYLQVRYARSGVLSLSGCGAGTGDGVVVVSACPRPTNPNQPPNPPKPTHKPRISKCKCQVLDLFEALSERGVRLRASSFNVLMEELAAVR